MVVSDIHLSHNPPAAREAESDWYGAMERTLNELKELIEQCHNPPLICCGDVFDRWNSPPELINFALKHLPIMYAVPGQHDEPHHRYEDLRKSAYQTLVEAGRIVNLLPGVPIMVSSSIGHRRRSLCLVGFPYGFEVKPFVGDADGALKVAVVHSYVWTAEDNSYPGAPKEKRLAKYRKALKGYDVALFGDNHQRFMAESDGCTVLNCGTLIRRKTDERRLKPMVGMLQDDGSLSFLHLRSAAEDKFTEGVAEPDGESVVNTTRFLKELEQLDEMEFDFVEVVKRFIDSNKLSERARRVLVEVMEQ
jgi:DNA repair exonuclease SbcCD nuclease subunit